MLKHAQEEARTLHEEIGRLEAEITAARTNKWMADKKAERLVPLVEELRMIRTTVDDRKNTTVVDEGVLTLLPRAEKPHRAMRMVKLAVIALVSVAGAALIYRALDARGFDVQLERLRAFTDGALRTVQTLGL